MQPSAFFRSVCDALWGGRLGGGGGTDWQGGVGWYRVSSDS
jgi:hypothetical protein